MSLQRILRTISTVPPPPPPPPPSQTFHNHQEEEQVPVPVPVPVPPALNYEPTKNKVLLGIDLNKSFPQVDDCNSPPAKIDGGATVSSVLESKRLSSVTACDLNFNENQEVSVGKNEIQIQYCSEVETSVIDGKYWEKQSRRWAALLEVTEIYSRKLEEDSEKDGREIQTRKQSKRRRTSGELELGGESQIDSRKQRNMIQTENASAAAMTEDSDDKNDRVKVVEAEIVVPPVVRSNRGRTQALPYKYRDSIVDPWTELSQQNKRRKSSPSKARARTTHSTVLPKPRSR